MAHRKIHVFTVDRPEHAPSVSTKRPDTSVLDRALEPHSNAFRVDPYVVDRRPLSALKDLRRRFIERYGEAEADGRSGLWVATRMLSASHVGVDEVAGELITYSDRNPDGQFDYYDLNGRYRRTLPGKRTIAQLKNINFDSAILLNEMEANCEYDQLEAATAGLEKGPSWEEMLAKHHGVGTTAFQEIKHDPWFAAAFDAVGRPYHMLDWDGVYGSGRDAFLLQYPAHDVPDGYIDLEGQWHDRGGRASGLLSDWTFEYRQFRGDLPGDIWITVVEAVSHS